MLAAAAVSASVYVNSGRNSMDDLFNAMWRHWQVRKEILIVPDLNITKHTGAN